MKIKQTLLILFVPFFLMGCNGSKLSPIGPKSATSYDENNKMTRKETYSYNEKGLPNESFYEDFKEDGSVEYKGKTVNTFFNDKLAISDYYSYDFSSKTYVYSGSDFSSYDSNGNEKTFLRTTLDEGIETPWIYSTYFYNNRNQLIHEENFSYKNQAYVLDYEIDYHYNDKDQLYEEFRHMVSFGDFLDKVTYTYNENGTLKESKEFDVYKDDHGIEVEDFVLGVRYTYDNSKNVSEITTYGLDDGGEEYNKIKETFEYNGNNQATKYSYYHLAAEDSKELVLDYYIVYEY